MVDTCLVSGVMTDASGAPLVNQDIYINANTIFPQVGGAVLPESVMVKTNASGMFSASFVPGIYRLSWWKSNFENWANLIVPLEASAPLEACLSGAGGIPVVPMYGPAGPVGPAGPSAMNPASAGYATRSDLVAAVAAGDLAGMADGKVVYAGGLAYERKSSASSIPDLLGFIPSGAVYVDHFGHNAVPGTTDMTTAIQSAINYCTSTKHQLNFTSKEYRTSKVTVSGRIEMFGGGQDATIIRTITGSTFTSLLEVASGSFIVSIYDMQWNGMARADRTIEFVDYPGSDTPYHKSLIMERCKVYGGIESQIRFGKRRYLAWVSNSEIYGGKSVIEFDTGADHRFVQCDFGGGSEKIINAVSTRSCVFTACHFYGSAADGIVMDNDCHRWVFNGGAIDTNQGDGFVWDGEGHIVSSVKFAGNALGNTAKSDIAYSGTNGILANCMFVLGAGATAPQYNIRVDVAAGNLYESGVVFQSGCYSIAASNDNRASGWTNQNMRGGLTSLARLDSSGRRIYDATGQSSPLLMTTTTVGIGSPATMDAPLHVANASGSTASIIESHTAGQSGDPAVIFRSGRGTVAAKLPAQSGDISGRLDYRAYDGAAYQNTARAKSEVDGAVSAGVTPGRYVIMVANASGVLMEKLRIDSAGNFTLSGVPTSNPGGSGRLWNDAGVLKIT